ncbi:hypothetical protein [Bradyrhizobium sp. 6(2017)]|nr:hypothetical protein [Bradyrhizobium sp. 6(2017)]
MDNKINEIRRRISTLRAEMTLIEASIRDQITATSIAARRHAG